MDCTSSAILTGTCYTSVEHFRITLRFHHFGPVGVAKTPSCQARDSGMYTAET